MCCGRFPAPSCRVRLGCGWLTNSAPGSTPSTSRRPPSAVSPSPICPAQRAVGAEELVPPTLAVLPAACLRWTVPTALRPGLPSDPAAGRNCAVYRAGTTVGLVGYGNIAKRVGDIVAAMGATVLHTSSRRRRAARLAAAARTAGRQRHRLAAPAVDGATPIICSAGTRWPG